MKRNCITCEHCKDINYPHNTVTKCEIYNTLINIDKINPAIDFHCMGYKMEV